CPEASFARLELIQDELQERQHQRGRALADRLQQFVKSIPIVLDACAPKPTRCGTTPSSQHCTGQDDGQPKADPGIEHSAHRTNQRSHASDQRHTGLCRAATLSITIIKDRKSTRLNSSHVKISYAVFCLKKRTD